MSPVWGDDHRDVAVDMVPDSVNVQVAEPRQVAVSDLHSTIVENLDSIASTYATHRSCHHRRAPQVFPVSAIQALTGREQVRYMRLLRSIASALGVQPFGSTRHILINVHIAARRLQFDTPGSIPGHDTDMPNRWLPTLYELQDMALHINMRYASQTTSGRRSPVRSRTPPGGRHRPHRPAVPHDTVDDKGQLPSCVTPGCPCTSTYNGQPGEACCRTCSRGDPCKANYHVRPMMQTGQRPTQSPPQDGLTYPHCVTPGCPCTATFNGQPGQACCRTCRQGTPCVANFHTRPFPDADRHSTLPPVQQTHSLAGACPQMPIDLSDDADMVCVEGSDGDMYDQDDNRPPPYAIHDFMDDLSGAIRSERAALTNTDRTSVGRIVVATVIIYVTWVTMQVIQRALERYLG
jgi:hypothetical protein